MGGGDKTPSKTPAKGAAKGPAKSGGAAASAKPAKTPAKGKGPSKTSALAEKIKAQQEAKRKHEEEEERLRAEQAEAQRLLDLEAEREEEERQKKILEREARERVSSEEKKKKMEEEKRLEVLRRLGADVTELPAHSGTGKKVSYGGKKKNVNRASPKVTPDGADASGVPEMASDAPGDAAAEDWEDDVADDWETAAEEELKEKPETTAPVGGDSSATTADGGSSSGDGKAEADSPVDMGGAGAPRSEMRSPIICVLGHVDSGKTKLLDTIRQTKVGEGEAGGITQQIGATFLPRDALIDKTFVLHQGKHSMSLPGLLVIDTPGHESFSNLRVRGSSLCDMAILVVDVLSGLEPQTIESLRLLQSSRIPFVVALNKIDRLTSYASAPLKSSRANLKAQAQATAQHYESLYNSLYLQFANLEVNIAPYWDRRAFPEFVSVVPLSALTGEGLPDLIAYLVTFAQNFLAKRLQVSADPLAPVKCTVLEVKAVEGLGTTCDVLLVEGELSVHDELLLCGFDGPIRTRVRALLTPQPMREMRVRGTYVRHSSIKAAMGVKVCADGLEGAVAGSAVYVVRKAWGEEEVREREREVMKGLTDLFRHVKDSGVSVQASTLGALEALLSFLHEIKIPVGQVNIGPVYKKHVMGAMVYLDREEPRRDLACILAFDVKVDRDAQLLAEQHNVRIFTSDVIYHLEELYVRYLKELKEEAKRAASGLAVFPAKLKIVPDGVFRDKNPMLLGVEVLSGWLQMGAPLCVIPDVAISKEREKEREREEKKNKDKDRDDEGNAVKVLSLGRVAGIQKDNADVTDAKTGDKVAIKVESDRSVQVGRHFSGKETVYVEIKRENIECLKEHYREELKDEQLKLIPLIKEVKNVLNIE